MKVQPWGESTCPWTGRVTFQSRLVHSRFRFAGQTRRSNLLSTRRKVERCRPLFGETVSETCVCWKYRVSLRDPDEGMFQTRTSNSFLALHGFPFNVAASRDCTSLHCWCISRVLVLGNLEGVCMFERKQNVKKPLDWTKLVIVFFRKFISCRIFF